MPAIHFRAALLEIGPWTIARLPAEASARLPSRGQVAVTGAVNDHAFATVLEPDGRRGHWLRLDGALLQAARAAGGDTVPFEIEPARDWPEPALPADFGRALAAAPEVSGLWQDITPMARWEWVRWICATRNPETRRRRIEVGLSKLRSGKRRPCCFDLAACTDPDLSRGGKLVEA